MNMKNILKFTLCIVFLFVLQNANSQCPIILENQSTGPNTITLSSQQTTWGIDSVIGVNDSGQCGITITNNDNDEPWAKYWISIDLAANGIQAGDELNTSIDAVVINGQARIEYNTNNQPNTAIASYSFNASGTYTSTLTVPAGINTIDIWLFSNYAQNTPGSNTYKNLNISKVVIGGDSTSPVISSFNSSSQTNSTIDLNWAATDDQGPVTYQLTRDGQNLGISPSATSYQVTGLMQDTSYTFTLTATDGSNNTVTNTINVSTSITGTPTGSSVWTETNSIASYTGKVGIGTTTPGEYELAVNGEIRAKEIKVEIANWPDYVFTKEYRLPSLEEVQKHINQNGHLINIPSALEIEANGLELGEMNKLLLEKIEELTLYVLEIKMENNQQQKEIESLKNNINY